MFSKSIKQLLTGSGFSGHSANTDIIVASAHAYVNALNRLYAALNANENAAADDVRQSRKYCWPVADLKGR